MKPVIVTTSWDDGHKLDLKLAALLQKYGIKGTFYVAPKNREFPHKDLLSTSQIKRLSKDFEIGAHTITHPRLPQTPDAQAEAEITESKTLLEKITGKPITTFCYPRGEYSSRHVAMVKRAGFVYARTIKRFSFGSDRNPLESATTVNAYSHLSDLWQIARTSGFNPRTFRRNLSWDHLAKRMFDQVLQTGGTYHLWGHSWEIDANGDWDKLEDVLKYISTKPGIRYATNGEIEEQAAVSAKDPQKNLLIAAPYFPPHAGGQEYYSYNLATRLQQDHGWQVAIVTSGKQGIGLRYTTDNFGGLTVYRLPYWFKISNTPINPFWPFLMKRVVKKEHISLINTHAPVPFFTEMLLRAHGTIPVVETYHMVSMKKGKVSLDWLISLYERFVLPRTLRKAAHIICSSEKVKTEFLHDFQKDSSTITPGVDAGFFKPAKKLAENTVLFVGSLNRSESHKGLEFLLEAFKEVVATSPKARLIIVGEGSARKKFEEQAAKLGIANTTAFMGTQQGEDLRRIYQNASMLVLPTLNDSFPLVLLEAMASGLPVVSTPVGGIPSIIDDGKNGFLVSPANSQELANKLSLLLKDKSLSRRLGKNGQQKMVKTLTWEKQAFTTNEVFTQTLYGYAVKPEKKEDVNKKLLLVTPFYYPHFGGVESYCLNIARRLNAIGWSVVVVTTAMKGDGASVSNLDGIKVYRLPYTLKISNTPIGRGWRKAIRNIIKTEQPNIINAHTPVPYLADIAERVRGKIPFILTYHNDIEKSEPFYSAIAKLFYTLMLNRTLKHAQRIVVTSQYYATESKYLKRYAQKLRIVSPGVDLQRFNPELRAKLFKKASKAPIILFVGGIGKAQQHKGLEYLIAAFAQVRAVIPKARLMVVGGGDGKQMYTKIAQKHSLADSITFTGFVPDEELPEYFGKASVFVLPSTNRSEGFGMVLAEASACGTPVIGTKVGGMPFLIQDRETGILVPPKDQEALTGAILEVLEGGKHIQKMAEGGVRRMRELFDWGKLAADTDTVLQETVKPPLVQVAGYYPPHLGGMEKVAQAISEKLAAGGHQVQVLTSRVGHTSDSTDLKSANTITNLTVKRFKGFEFAHTPFTPKFIYEIFNVPKGSVVHLHLAQAFYPELVLAMSKLRGIPYIVHFHLDLMPSGPLGKLFLLYKATVLRTVIAHADAMIVFSKEQQEFVHNEYGLPKGKITIIPNGVGPEFFLSPKTSFNTKQFHLLYVGRLSTQKRVDRLIDALRLVSHNVALSIVGDGEDREKLQAQVKSLKLKNVTFVGQKTGKELQTFYRKADVFVLPSEREGMPLVLLEAMAGGLPIIGSNVVGIRELIGGVGVLVDDPSPETFAQAIDTTLNGEQELIKLSQASHAKAQEYSWDKLMVRLEKLYGSFVQ